MAQPAPAEEVKQAEPEPARAEPTAAAKPEPAAKTLDEIIEEAVEEIWPKYDVDNSGALDCDELKLFFLEMCG